MTDEDRLLKILAGLAADLGQVWDDLGWAWALGWDVPKQAVVDRGSPLVHPVDPADPDGVPGGLRETGLGSDACRRAVRAAVAKLAEAERALSDAMVAMGSGPDFLVPPAEAGLAQARFVVRTLQIRAGWLEAKLGGLAGRDRPAAAERAVINAHGAARAALKVLASAINRGSAGDDDEANPDMCRVCEIRPLSAKKHGRCHTCDWWFYKHGRRERPRGLDLVAVAAAQEAKVRRTERGEGWGVG